jgi:K+-transporting ATPase ATPase C chain
LRTALTILLLLVLITGLIYPFLLTGIAQIVFNSQANGSLITIHGQYFGSRFIGQSFDDPEYFWGRLSATTLNPYNAAASSGSNYGPLNPALKEAIIERIRALKLADPDNTLPIPVDLVTCSASGLDPHISIAAASYQSFRVAHYRKITADKVNALIERFTEGRQFGVLGEPRVNVLLLNMALDQMLE